ncbi:tripartite tricarboxylate transporter TctB family protein [Chelatococcus asaccharovorans]|uniref:Tripartite tricarboxylate transporter TctB family protein n=1 Tax=Chelatococcus asaccharovorans TaxID=28210 RepID=A0A2V3TY41_9HYPH|nr:tripartite tricarboxylate transporter TctB family protein [Chelatococcus asaccharovorans]MBS7707488.1 tripartite tricarboxylate transporter TctB family protein [Chelatococcus asaccharovorans]PXW54192.1 tripartite tricarboxylate transporter TctB family protein [Chelatococcus asaccharovorans]
MQTQHGRDLVAGGALVVFGASFAGYAATNFKLGSFAQMGPGMFPLVVGATVVALGTALLLTTVLRTWQRSAASEGPEPERADWRTLVIVVLSIAVFALLVRRFGMAPAVVGLVLVSSFASRELPLPKMLALAAGLAVMGWAIFIVMLGLPIKLLAWPL